MKAVGGQVEYRGWRAADPACSLAIGALVLAAAVPLVRSAAAILLQATPPEAEVRGGRMDV